MRNQYSINCPICREDHVQNVDKDIPKNRLIINFIHKDTHDSKKNQSSIKKVEKKASTNEADMNARS